MTKATPIHVYVAGPLTGSGLEHENVRRAIDVAHYLATNPEGIDCPPVMPFVPHLMAAQWAVVHPGLPAEFWLSMCFAWVEKCDAMVMIDGESPGTEREVALAKKLGLSVYDCESSPIEAARMFLKHSGKQAALAHARSHG